MEAQIAENTRADEAAAHADPWDRARAVEDETDGQECLDDDGPVDYRDPVS